jgi:myo-inositol 2-dehydrogenase / D-chiro-inositol 1-dehydrogenase
LKNIGIAGIGHMGKSHLFNILKNKEINLVGVADQSKNNRIFAQELGIKKIFQDYNELFKEPGLDAVVISLPNFLKKDSVQAAAENHLDILLDKPLARNYDEACEIKRIIENSGTQLMVGVNSRYYPHIKKMKAIIDSGSIGESKITTLEYINHGPFTHPLNPKPVPEWWFEKEKTGGGALLDMGWHTIDLFSWLFGEAQLESANLINHFNLDVEDGASVILKSKNGGIGVNNVGWFSHLIFPRIDFRVISHGTSGYCSTDDLRPNIYANAVKEGLINFKRRIFLQPINILTWSYYFSSFNELLLDFVKCLEEDKPFPVNFDQQLNVQKIIEDVYTNFSKKPV